MMIVITLSELIHYCILALIIIGFILTCIIACFRAIKKKDNMTWCCCLATLCFIALDILLTIKIK